MITTWLEQYLTGVPATRILDLGPGYNDFARIAARVTGARELTFADFSDEVLAWQRAQAEAAGLSVRLFRGDFSRASIAALPGDQDVVLCQEVLEHLPDAPEILRLLASKLARDGRIVITIPTRVSERLLKAVNPGYMRNEPYGHVNEFDRRALLRMLEYAGLEALVLFPTQPHYFLGHLWLFGTRVRTEGSSGRILGGGFRVRIFAWIVRASRAFFIATGPHVWGHIFPRNYFIVARRHRNSA